MQKNYVFNSDFILKEDNDKICAVSMSENDNRYFIFEGVVKNCLQMFADGKTTNEIADFLKVHFDKEKSTDEINVFLEKNINDLLALGILK